MKDLIPFAEVPHLRASEVARLYARSVNPGVIFPLRVLGLAGIEVVRASGVYLECRDGRRILDAGGGMGVLALGHNHPRIVAVRRAIEAGGGLEYSKAILSPWVAALAHNLTRLAPGDLDHVFFCNSGAEAIEGALKTAQRHHPDRDLILHSDLSFHGKTHAALAVSALDDSRHRYKTISGCQPFPYNDPAALAALLARRRGRVIAVVLEAVAGLRVVPARPGYLRAVRDLCDEHGVLLILDEVLTGFGRTGRLFACEHDGIVPDLLCFAKGISGGKASLGGVLVRRPVFARTWGRPDAAFEQTTTYAGLAGECATALETLAVIVDEDLSARAAEQGGYFLERLRGLRRRHPRQIGDVRGQGLLLALELHPECGGARRWLAGPAALLARTPEEIHAGLLVGRLINTHGILPAVSAHRRDLIIFCPPLTITRAEIDSIVDALDEVLTTGLARLSLATVRRWLAG